ncbi:MAG: hypothetical protein KGH60_00400 [Candidatus Micrarchaeota archaeon]|nr:hypothetical protein [Candidatus Micrarchaeota archaeon]
MQKKTENAMALRAKKADNARILRENRFFIIRSLMRKKTIREIAKEIGVSSYYVLYDYLATGSILHDN